MALLKLATPNDAHNVKTKPGGNNPWFLDTLPNEPSLNQFSGCCALLW
jgi:hypothetical protein